MALGREVSLGVGLATAALVWGVYNSALPSIVDARVAPPADADLEAAERTATWTSTAVVAGVSLLSKDATVFVLGGTMVVVLAWWHRHANAHNPMVSAGGMTPGYHQALNAAGDQSAGYSPGA